MRVSSLSRALLALGAGALLTAGCPNTTNDTPPTGGDTSTQSDQTGTPDGGQTDTAVVDIPKLDTSADVEAAEGTVKAAQLLAESVGCDETLISTVAENQSLKGVVITSPKFDAFTPEDATKPGLDGYFVADADGGAWSGIMLTVERAPGVAFAVDEANDLKPGDVVDADGEITEFYCQTQFDAATVTKTGSQAPLEPTPLNPEDVAQEAMEGMLVKVLNVQVTEEIAPGTYKMTGGFTVTHNFPFFLQLQADATYDLTGVVGFSYGEYKLLPRTASDVYLHPSENETAIKDIQGDPASTDCADNGITTIKEGLTIRGVVTVPKFYVTGTLDGYYLSDGTQDPYSGILLVVSKDLNTDFAVGDQVVAIGKHTEFYCLTEFNAQSVEVAATGQPVPDPVVVDFADLQANTEQWEGVTIEVDDVTVSDTADWMAYGQFSINNSDIQIDTSILGKDVLTDVEVGTHWDTVRGVLRYSFNKYRIAPRTLEDLITGGGTVEPTPDVVDDTTTTDAADDTTTTDAGPVDDAAADAAADAASDAADDTTATDAAADAATDTADAN